MKRFGDKSTGDLFVTVYVEIPKVEDKYEEEFSEENFKYEKVSDYEKLARNLSKELKAK